MLFALSFNSLCLGLCTLTQGRYSILKARTFWSIFPKRSGIVVQMASCFFQRTALYAPGPSDALALRMKKGHSCLPSLLPCHSLPCLSITSLLAIGDPRNPRPGGSYWSGGSQTRDSHAHVGWSQAPRRGGSGSSPSSFGPFRGAQRDYPETLRKPLVTHFPGRAWFPLPFYNSSFVLKHLNPHHLN